MFVASCGAFHTKQPVDDTYYKNTQSIAWPEQQTTTAVAKTTSVPSVPSASSSSNSVALPVGTDVTDNTKWEDPTAPKQKMAVPKDPGLKLQCAKQDNGTYTCKKGQYVCGWGCKSDGSNCSNGYCLESDCNDVMGQKWNLVREGDRFVCRHPDYPVRCSKVTGWQQNGIMCRNENGRDDFDYNVDACGWNCNANGTQCQNGANNCWDKFR